MSSIRFAATLRRFPALLLAVAWLTACGAGAQAGSQPTSPGVQARPSRGSSDVLTREQIDRINAYSMEQLLQGRFNGVRVTRFLDGELNIRIRGENEPLIVLDGTPGLNMASLWLLNPSDIEEIRVLRESATGLYGLQGANGVLVITTRKR